MKNEKIFHSDLRQCISHSCVGLFLSLVVTLIFWGIYVNRSPSLFFAIVSSLAVGFFFYQGIIFVELVRKTITVTDSDLEVSGRIFARGLKIPWTEIEKVSAKTTLYENLFGISEEIHIKIKVKNGRLISLPQVWLKRHNCPKSDF